MDSIKDFFQSIYDNYTDRIKSPFIGSFILSFVIFNWRAFAILLYSDWPIHCRIEWIEDKYCLVENFWWPIVISLFYILILPYINLGFEWLLSTYTNKKQLKKNFIRNADLIRKKSEAKLKREIADEEASTSEIMNLNTTIKNLTSEINVLNDQHQKEILRLKNIEKKSNEIVKDIQLEIDEVNRDKKILSKMVDDVKAESERRFIPEFMRKIINQLSTRDKIYFVNICDFYIFKTAQETHLNIIAFEMFKKLELFSEVDDFENAPKKLTEKGQYLYHILRNTL